MLIAACIFCETLLPSYNSLLRYPTEPAFVIPKCLKEKVDAGDLGRKSGKGFYHWNGERRGDAV